MAWNTEETRRKLLEAGTQHFAASGLAGARVDAIARDAGVNKERIYQYFGDKAGLFTAVLAREIDQLLDGIVITGHGADALGALAAALYDRAAEHPHLTRLLLWESVELDDPISADERRTGCASMVAALQDATTGRESNHAAETLLSIIAIAFADSCLPHLTELINPNTSRASRRQAVILQARAFAE